MHCAGCIRKIIRGDGEGKGTARGWVGTRPATTVRILETMTNIHLPSPLGGGHKNCPPGDDRGSGLRSKRKESLLDEGMRRR
ncbi:hypothetical protein E2C01_013421 [Portunus trituberculatus]|uniref:Uncharacterized protein n=1 Tax=Portunus trituberculatus TaxID=210409 RepID=A0A5B7DH86_PORTR|nr:hypothetical protein [Portunus trituberculatus]